MSQERLSMTDELYDYLDAVSDREAPVLAELRAETRKDPRYNMQMTPNQGQFMQTLVLATGAKRILEVGTFTGYSALAMALALPADGHLITLDISDAWTKLGQRFWQKAGVADKIELRLAPGKDSMDALSRRAGKAASTSSSSTPTSRAIPTIGSAAWCWSGRAACDRRQHPLPGRGRRQLHRRQAAPALGRAARPPCARSWSRRPTRRAPSPRRSTRTRASSSR